MDLANARDRFKDVNKHQQRLALEATKQIDALQSQLRTAENQLNANAARQMQQWHDKVAAVCAQGATVTNTLELVSDVAGRLGKAQRMLVQQEARTAFILKLADIKENLALRVTELQQTAVQNLFDDFHLILHTFAETIQDALPGGEPPKAPGGEAPEAEAPAPAPDPRSRGPSESAGQEQSTQTWERGSSYGGRHQAKCPELSPSPSPAQPPYTPSEPP